MKGVPVRGRHRDGVSLLFAALLVLLTAGCAASDPLLHEEWQVITLGGQPIGYSHTLTRRIADPEPRICTVVFERAQFSRLGLTLQMRTTAEHVESPEGDLLEAALSLETGGLRRASRARVEGEEIVIANTVADRTSSHRVPRPANLTGPHLQRLRTRAEALRDGARIEYKTLAPGLQGSLIVATCALTVTGKRPLDVEGKTLSLWFGTVEQDIAPGLPIEVWMDDAGNVIRSRAAALGGLETRLADEAEALGAFAGGAHVDLLEQSFIASDRVLERPYETTEAVYRITGPKDALARLAVEDRRQEILAREEDSLRIRVRAVADAEASGAPPDAAYLRATPYAESDDPELVAAARKVVEGVNDPREKALRLRRWVFDYIRKKDLGVAFASAKETFVTRQGDCTEHGVLLAAMLRAVGIPSRVAVGLVYYKGRFGYHLWTEAFLNDWTALDATMKQDVVDATHIKLAESSLDEKTALASFTPILTVIGRIELHIEDIR